MNRAGLRTVRRSWWALVPLVPLVVASCSSGTGGSPSADTSLKSADATVLAAVGRYPATVNLCPSASSPVVCVEAADRTLGGRIHTYANVLAVGHGFAAPPADLTAARNAAQTLANSLEILGDAQPTQANYDRVRNTFDVSSALAHLRSTVTTLDSALGG